MLISPWKTRILKEDEMVAMINEVSFQVVVVATAQKTLKYNEFANIIHSRSDLVGEGRGRTCKRVVFN